MFNRLTHKKSLKLGWISLACLVVLSACALFGKEVTVNLTEQSVNQAISNASASAAADQPFRITGIDMKDGYMRVAMAYRKADGTDVTGSYDLAFKVVNGQLVSEIQHTDMSGLELDSPTTQQIADLISRDFITLAVTPDQQVKIKSITISEDALQMSLQVK
jgi:hypothetical protein